MDSIIFDVDGTLWDSTEIVADAWTRYLKEERHINMDITAEKLKSLFGQLLPRIAAKQNTEPLKKKKPPSIRDWKKRFPLFQKNILFLL